ncbi:hypothetical protein J3458_019605 [Metarhizium acridum]|uniref:uncharacterized protein n=1 Tax=Metarhizium acridum TaxID=92637 RepID=UPI001C6B6C87|nr:hypothetical protein J3458_019605 [Metarhizium acridum]
MNDIPCSKFLSGRALPHHREVDVGIRRSLPHLVIRFFLDLGHHPFVTISDLAGADKNLVDFLQGTILGLGELKVEPNSACDETGTEDEAELSANVGILGIHKAVREDFRNDGDWERPPGCSVRKQIHAHARYENVGGHDAVGLGGADHGEQEHTQPAGDAARQEELAPSKHANQRERCHRSARPQTLVMTTARNGSLMPESAKKACHTCVLVRPISKTAF